MILYFTYFTTYRLVFKQNMTFLKWKLLCFLHSEYLEGKANVVFARYWPLYLCNSNLPRPTDIVCNFQFVPKSIANTSSTLTYLSNIVNKFQIIPNPNQTFSEVNGKNVASLLLVPPHSKKVHGTNQRPYRDIDVQKVFLLSSTGQTQNCTGHLPI